MQIIDVETQLCGSENLSGFPVAPGVEEQPFDLLREGDFFSLTNGQSKISRLNKKTSSDLSALTEALEIRLQAFTSISNILDIIHFLEDGTRGSHGKSLSVEINIYGSEKDANEVGILLGKTRNFLQPPRYGLENMTYKNPQILSIAGFSEETRIPHTAAYENKEDNSSHEDEQTVSQDDDADNVDDFLDTGLRHVSRANISVDRRIQTELREWVEFWDYEQIAMSNTLSKASKRSSGLHLSPRARRNAGRAEFMEIQWQGWRWAIVSSSYLLQFLGILIGNFSSYQHVLNGERKSQPDHARGGILADEMGLGKTLVILSVIAGTLDQAKEFEGSDIDEYQLQIQPQPKLNSQATLILVPSTRTPRTPFLQQ